MAKTEGVFRVMGLDKTIRSLHVDLQSELGEEDWEKVYEVLKVPLRKADELHRSTTGKIPEGTKQKTLPRGKGELLDAIRARTVSEKRGLRINVGFSISAIGKEKGYWRGLRARFINTGTKVSGMSRYKAGLGSKNPNPGRPIGTPLIEPQYFIYYSYRDELGEGKDAVSEAVNDAIYKVLMEKK